MSAREILDKLIISVDRVQAEFTYADDIHRNIDLQIRIALLSLAEMVKGEKKQYVVDYRGITPMPTVPELIRNDAIEEIAKMFDKPK